MRRETWTGGGAGAAAPIGALVREVLKARGIARPSYPAGLASAWAEAVGPASAAATRVGGLRAGVLTVEVESSALRCELQTFYHEDLVDRLQVLAPNCRVRRIAFRPWGRR